MKVLEHELVRVKVADLQEDPDNPNSMTERQMDALDAGFDKFGFLVPIVIDQNNKIWDGHHRVRRYRLHKIEEINAYRVNVANDAEGKLLRNLLNNLRGTQDPKRYAQELKVIFDNNRLDDLSRLLARPKVEFLRQLAKHQLVPLTTEDEFDIDAEMTKPTRSQVGEVYQLGPHRVMCGDCCKPEDVRRLLGNALVDQVNTDPPFGVDYSEKNSFLNEFNKGNNNQSAIKHDSGKEIEDYRAFFASFLRLVPFADYNTVYVFMSGKELHNLRLGIEDAGLTWSNYLVWIKNKSVLGRKDYNAQHEFIFYGWKGRHKFYGPVGSTRLEYPKPNRSELHPTMKPLELVGRLISDGTEPGMTVYDPFGGSGSTLLAAEQTGRICFTMELLPKYVDVIIARWEAYSGKKAELVK